MLLATVQSVLATPLPTPEVIVKTLQVPVQVPVQTPAVVLQAVQIVVVFLAALALSVLHQVVEWVHAKEQGWNPNLNRLLATLYSVGVALVGTAGMHQLGTTGSDLVALALSSAVALSGSFWTFELRKSLADLTGFAKKQGVATTTDSQLPTVTNP